MKISGIKSKLLLAFIMILVIITGLNVGLSIFLTTKQSEREAFTSLTRQTTLLQNELQETIIKLRAIAEKNVAGIDNLSDLSTLYSQTKQLTAYPDLAAENERSLLFNKVISMNRLQIILQTANFSSAAVYLDNELSHYVTTTEAGMSRIRIDHSPLLKTGQNQDEDLDFNNWPNWNEGVASSLITSQIPYVDHTTISFDFSAEQMVVLEIIIPIQATTQAVMKENVTLGSPEGILVNDLSIATPEMLNQNTDAQNPPTVIGSFVFKKVFDLDFLGEIAEKTSLLPALYSPDGIHQVQVVDMKMNPADMTRWVQDKSMETNREILQHTLEVDHEYYYQTLTLWQFEEEAQLIIGFSESAASTTQKVRETVAGLVGVAGLVLLVAGTLGYLMFDRLVKPIQELTSAVSSIGLSVEQGSLNQLVVPIASDKLVEINLRANDEVGQLTTAFNTMIRQLRQSFETLEQRVVERTRDLTISAEVSRQVATILSQSELLTQLVEQTKSSFDFYQVSIFKYIPDDQTLRLVAASGEAGQLMSADRKTFLLSDQGIVPRSAKKQQVMISSDVLRDPYFLPNPYLPLTQSEAALPIMFGGELIGVLDLQSEQKNRFVEKDIELFSSFANQLAVAFRNATLFEDVEAARQKAELADKAKSAFLASTSHELRTPLNAIINLSSFVKRGLVGPVEPRQVEILSLVMQSGQHLLTLINDVLDMSKIESGSLKLYPEPDIDLRPIIETVYATAQGLLQDKPVELKTQIPDNLPTLTMDKHRTQQILLNLLSNACKFTEEGQISLCVDILDTVVQVAVHDTGVGIAEEDVSLVFEKFAQTESGLRQGGGTGLGMPITKNLVEAQGGVIWLESQQGVGSTFYFTIPINGAVINTNDSQKESMP